jgi:hypothetical protein
VRGIAELAPGHGAGHPGQDRIGLGGVVGGQDPGLVLDDPQVDRVDLPGAQRGEAARQPVRHGAGVVHLPGG